MLFWSVLGASIGSALLPLINIEAILAVAVSQAPAATWALVLAATAGQMIGKVLWQEFFNNRDWPVASALAVVMLVILLVPIILFNRNQTKELEGKL